MGNSAKPNNRLFRPASRIRFSFVTNVEISRALHGTSLERETTPDPPRRNARAPAERPIGSARHEPPVVRGPNARDDRVRLKTMADAFNKSIDAGFIQPWLSGLPSGMRLT